MVLLQIVQLQTPIWQVAILASAVAVLALVVALFWLVVDSWMAGR